MDGLTDRAFAAELLARRGRAGLSQPELAELAGIKIRTYRRLEQAERGCNLDELARLAGALGTHMTELAYAIEQRVKTGAVLPSSRAADEWRGALGID
ncbi:helix-turn-helix domain-containing protein [Nocardia sp. NPDC057440]|uniref:helix-turn-helix domain-containing protein n=1 Tax=Nocardia sp. NPDC057440 TaxID=3346134 RepID=UPI00366AA04B